MSGPQIIDPSGDAPATMPALCTACIASVLVPFLVLLMVDVLTKAETAVLRLLTIIALILPLAIDTFVLSNALGVAGLAKRERFRTRLLLTAFEAGMPVVGFVIGTGLRRFIGQWADYVRAIVLAGTGVWMLWPRGGEDEEEERKAHLLESARGWAILCD